MRHILFGDSIGFGVGDYHNGGWATQLRLLIDRDKKAKNNNLINLSIAGDTSRHLLARMEKEAKLRIRDKDSSEFRFLIAIGANDARVDKVDANNNISPAEFRQNIGNIIQIAKQLSKELVLIGLLPVDESLITPYKEEKYYFNEQLKKYNQILKEIAEEQKLNFVNMFEEWTKKDWPTLLDDGLHPNTSGHQLIFEAVKSELFK